MGSLKYRVSSVVLCCVVFNFVVSSYMVLYFTIFQVYFNFAIFAFLHAFLSTLLYSDVISYNSYYNSNEFLHPAWTSTNFIEANLIFHYFKPPFITMSTIHHPLIFSLPL